MGDGGCSEMVVDNGNLPAIDALLKIDTLSEDGANVRVFSQTTIAFVVSDLRLRS